MSSQTKTILIGVAVVLAAVGALLLATSRSDSEENSVEDVVFSGNRTTAGESAPAGSVSAAIPQDELILEFLPRGGIGAACSEDVGVQVAQGFSAELTINGTKMAPEELNVILNPDGTISNEISATRSKGQFSFTPESSCPNGRLVRPTDNVLSVCVYSSSDVTRSCVLTETFEFDAI